ncbi:hypothetical protein ig2599ANME_2190 [groundwater metagenome]
MNHKQNILYIFKGIKSTCNTGITLSKQTIYDIMTGKLSMKMIQDERADSLDPCIFIMQILLGVCCCCCFPCAIKHRAKQDKEREERIKSMSEKELLAEIVRNQERR